MKRQHMAVIAAIFCVAFAGATRAQMGMDFFKKPGIADFFKPVVGHGVVYEEQHDGKKRITELTIVGKEIVDGKEGYWMESGMEDAKAGGIVYGKVLVTADDFQFHRSVSQMPGQQPVEFTFPKENRKLKSNNDLDKWHKVGTETITVPAGTFSCDHWSKDDGKNDVWLSSKVSPFGLVKEVSSGGRTSVLVKVIMDAKDHITGTPKKFDPEEIKRQMMEKMQQMQQQKPQPKP